jgi:hypothetical protein
LAIEEYDKIDVARILIERVDGRYSHARVSSVAAANIVLENWAQDAPEEGEDECNIKIVFEDGFQYRSCMTLRRSQKRISLARHVRQQLKEKASPKRSRRLNDQEIHHCNISDANNFLSAETMLHQYDI